MIESDLRKKLTAYTGEFMTAVLLVQPLLDVLSFFMISVGATVITTSLRLVLLVLVSAYGFVITDRRRLHITVYAVIGGFWLLHVLNCLRGGYNDPIGDLAEYLKLVQFPLWTMAFITFFEKDEGLDLRIVGIVAVNFAIILLVVVLSFGTGHPVYTYEYPERGIFIGTLGWFGEANSQSVVLTLVVPMLMLWGLRTGLARWFSLCCAAGLGLLFLTGTRLTYYAAILLTLVFLVLVFVERKRLVFFIPLTVGLVLLIALKGISPMQVRQGVTSTSFSVYQEKIDTVMGEDAGYRYNGKEIPEKTLAKVRQVYTEIYGERGEYGEMLLGDLIGEYGADRVMETFEYSVSPEVLNNTRDRKLRAVAMVWEDKGFLTHLLGLEYSDVLIGQSNYDPENDFPSLLYFTGYLGAAVYVGFLIWVIGTGAFAFLRRFPELLESGFVTAAVMAALFFGAALITGHTLRRTNVLVYAALSAALVVHLARRPAPRISLRRRSETVRVRRL